MEGGVYPWKRQRPELDGVVYADYSAILKPLPPPPDGLTWVKRRVEVEEEDAVVERDSEGIEEREVRAARFVWELVEKPARPGPEESAEEPPLVELEDDDDDDLPDFIEHTVLATDTMAGLRLRYKITPAELRKHNDFAGENFHMLPTLQIPIQGREAHIKKHKQRPTKEVLRQRFSNATRCTDFQMQTYYLEANDWDLAAAVRECEEDRKWEEEHGARQHMTRVPVTEGEAAGEARNNNNNNNDYSAGMPIQQQPQEPPPSYMAFFKIKARRQNNRPSHYYPWPINAATSSSSSSSATSLLRRPSARGAYDMAPMLMEDFAAATNVQEEEGGFGGDYMRIEGDGDGEGTAAPVPVPVAVAVVAPRHGSNYGELEGSHEAALRAPLLGRAE